MAEPISSFSTGELASIWIYLLLLGIVGILSNGIILFLFGSTKSLQTPMNCLFISLTVGDFMVSLFGTLPSGIFTAAQITMDKAICQVYGFLTFLGGSADGIGLSVIALERYLTVVRPFNIGSLNRSRATFWIGYTWLMAAFVSGLPLVGISSYTGEGAGTWCSIDWQVKDLMTDMYIAFIFIMDYFMPIIIIVVSYYIVVDKVAQVAKTGASESSVKAQKAVTMQAIAMIVGYLIAWTPYAIVCLVVSITGKDVFGPKLAMLPPLFAKSSFVYNPFIYVGLNKQFKKAFVEKILCGYDPTAKKVEDGGKSQKDVEISTSYNATVNDESTKAGELQTVSNAVSGNKDEPTLVQKVTLDTAKVSPQPS